VRTRFHDYGSNDILLETDVDEPVPETIVVKSGEQACTYKIIKKTLKPKRSGYEEYHFDDVHYWISGLCSNCGHSSQIAILKGVEFNKNKLKLTVCPRCEIKGTIDRAYWDGKMYRVSI